MIIWDACKLLCFGLGILLRQPIWANGCELPVASSRSRRFCTLTASTRKGRDESPLTASQDVSSRTDLSVMPWPQQKACIKRMQNADVKVHSGGLDRHTHAANIP